MHSSLLLNPTTVGGTVGLCDVSSGRIIGGDDDATGDGVDAEGGDGVVAEGGDAGDVTDACPELSSYVLSHIFRLAKRTALTERPGVLSRVVSLEVLFNMTVDGIRDDRGMISSGAVRRHLNIFRVYSKFSWQ